MSPSLKRLSKEFLEYRKNPPCLQHAQLISLNPIDSEDLYHWHAVIAKPTITDSKWYYSGQWTLNISIPHSYPQQPPKITFLTSIIHPNVDIKSGEICLDILKSSWSPAWNLQSLVVAVLQLMDHPEPDSPLNVDAANLYRCDLLAFESLVQFYIWQNCNFYKGEVAKYTSPKREKGANKDGYFAIRDGSGRRLCEV
ncbi:hypothetical protein KGF56_003623 [Candida oxycetoniae]|uniref:UBC core domain-containing protein n=1 Tax=Candida oxycetoniae TaxID=497107 RepID=A0AAI9WX12_9ASCO|nr:uncharacterized protein KGF56_003623 [Candida oxycetoniae]KAI3403578.2 hypothetical protein KGF56_003623 [Candida oxycetoniae]